MVHEYTSGMGTKMERVGMKLGRAPRSRIFQYENFKFIVKSIQI